MGRLLVPVAVVGLVAMLYWARRDPAAAKRLGERIRPLAMLALALLYLGSPIDIIPDGSLIGMIDDLVVLLAALYFGRAAPEPERRSRGTERARPPRQPPAAESDPFTVLGVARGASQEEIVKAFRDKMKQYHPDRVADLGEELQKLAHEKAVEIRRAYDALKKG